MLTYIIKRVLLMIPTIFFIALIIFMVLNLAPGRPGGAQAGQQGMQSTESQESRESYRIFKEQFNFDKPILFNTRFGLGESDVRSALTTIADYNRPICQADAKIENCIPVDQKANPGLILELQENLENWGGYSVPGLMAVVQKSDRLDVRRMAVNTLAQNARRRLLNEYGKKKTKTQKQYNTDVQTENDMTRKWQVGPEATAADIDKLVQESWVPWYTKHKAKRFTYGGGDKLSIFFTDTRFAKYMGNLVSLDFGVSHVDKKPVLGTIKDKLKYSITLSLLSIIIAYLISVPLGIGSAYWQNTPGDKVVTVILFMLFSLPSFFIAVVLLEIFALKLGIAPPGGFGDANTENMTALEQLWNIIVHLTLPVICLTYRSFASLSRYARTGVLDVIKADYIRTARAKGLSEPMVIIKHAVRNGMIPILTLLGALLPSLIGGSVIIEVIFNIPGMGSYLFESISARDYNAIMAVLLSSSVLTLIGLLISDISYAVVDPRISFD